LRGRVQQTVAVVFAADADFTLDRRVIRGDAAFGHIAGRDRARGVIRPISTDRAPHQ